MSTIRMETENVSDAARKIDYAVQELSLKPRRLKSAANSLTGAWKGGKARYFAGELKKKAKILETEVANLQQLAQRMRNEVNEWEMADSHWDSQAVGPSMLAWGTGEGPIETPGEGSESQTYPDLSEQIENAKRNEDIYRWGVSLPVDMIVLLPVVPIIPGALVSIIAGLGAGGLEFERRVLENRENYQDPYERGAADLLDFAFVSVKTAIITGAKIAAGELLKGALVAALTGAGIGLALASMAVGALLWAAGEFLVGPTMDAGYEFFKDTVVRGLAKIVKKLKGGVDSVYSSMRSQICAAPA